MGDWKKNLAPLAIPLALLVVVVGVFALMRLSPDLARGPSTMSARSNAEAEYNYGQGIASLRSGDWTVAASSLLELSHQNYKDSAVLYAVAQGKAAAAEGDGASVELYLKQIPDTYAGELSDLVLKSKQELQSGTYQRSTSKTPQVAAMQMKLVSFRWGRETDRYVRGVGEVQNTSNEPLKHVEAVVSFYDANDVLIKTETALVQYDPIMPGQTSPFEVIGTYNPLMKTATIDFAYLMGGQIPTDFGEYGKH